MGHYKKMHFSRVYNASHTIGSLQMEDLDAWRQSWRRKIERSDRSGCPDLYRHHDGFHGYDRDRSLCPLWLPPQGKG